MPNANFSTSNPYGYLYDVSPLLTACGTGGPNCRCTDPSYSYNEKPCKVTSATNSDNSNRSHCYFGPKPITSGITPSTGGSLSGAASKAGANIVFKVKPNNNTTQPFTRASEPTIPTNGADNQYPGSLLFCLSPTGTGTGGANVTESKNNVNFTGGRFITWSQPGSANKSSNLGFETN